MSEDLVITVDGVEDIIAPEVEVNIYGNKFKDFINRITFGLFFKSPKTVYVTADDFGSGVDKVEYLLSETAFTDQDVITGNWAEITLEDRRARFNIESAQKAFVYVRVTDKSGNVTVVNSSGVVVYTDAEAITGTRTFTMGSDFDMVYLLSMNGNSVSAVYNGTEKLSDTDYLVSKDGSFTLKTAI